MDCRKSKRLLDACVAHELDADTAASVAAHLETCPSCRADEASYKKALGALHEVGAVTLEPGFAFYRDVSRRLDAVRTTASPKESQPVRWYFVGSVAAAAAAVFLLVAYVIPGYEPPQGASGAPGQQDLAVAPSAVGVAAVPVAYGVGDNGGQYRMVSDRGRTGSVGPELYFPRYPRDMSGLFRQDGYVSMEEYRKLEERIKTLEARLVSLEEGRYSDVSR